MTSEYRMMQNAKLNPYRDINFDPNLDLELEELLGLEDSEPLGPVFTAERFDAEDFFDSYEPACRVIHEDEEDEPEFKGFDELNRELGLEDLFGESCCCGNPAHVPDPADTICWEEKVFDMMDVRQEAEANLKLQLDRLEAEAILSLDSENDGESWLASAVLKHLSLIRRAVLMLDLLPAEKEIRRTLNRLNGTEA